MKEERKIWAEGSSEPVAQSEEWMYVGRWSGRKCEDKCALSFPAETQRDADEGAQE